MIDWGSCRLYWLASAAPAQHHAAAAAINRDPLLIMLPSPCIPVVILASRLMRSGWRTKAAPERVHQIQALLVVHVATDFHLPAVRAQRHAAAVPARHHLCPVAVECAPVYGARAGPLDFHRVALDFDQLVVRRVA